MECNYEFKISIVSKDYTCYVLAVIVDHISSVNEGILGIVWCLLNLRSFCIHTCGSWHLFQVPLRVKFNMPPFNQMKIPHTVIKNKP